MSNAVVLNEAFDKSGEQAVPAHFQEVSLHNLYLYTKSYAASLRANSASTKTRAEVSGTGKKPWSQKGSGRARVGSTRNPVWRGGGSVFGPKSNRNYTQKVNKKQKKLALLAALNEKAQNGALFIVDKITIESGKTKDAAAVMKKLNARDALFVSGLIDDKTFYAFRNLSNAYLIEENEFNAYLAAAYRNIVIEKAVWENLVKEG